MIDVLKPGLLSTVQDRGRHGQQYVGVVPGGAMDTVAMEIANGLVGNRAGEAALEITVLGPDLIFDSEALIAVCGGRFDATVDGHPLPWDRPVLLPRTARLRFRQSTLGSRAYLAVAGGIVTPPVLGSRSTYLPAKFGGYYGRALVAGDRLPLLRDVAELSRLRYRQLKHRKEVNGLRSVGWSAPALTLPEREPVVVHALEGRHHDLFDAASRRAFFEATWKVSPESNRMGFRFVGPVLSREQPGDLLSEPACRGTVQVPAGGAPIALMADHQSTGGYPKIAEVAGADVPRLAQLPPGGTVQFARCTLEQARELRRVLRHRIDTSLRALSWSYAA